MSLRNVGCTEALKSSKCKYCNWTRARKAHLYQNDSESVMAAMSNKTSAETWALLNKQSYVSQLSAQSNTVSEHQWLKHFTELYMDDQFVYYVYDQAVGSPWSVECSVSIVEELIKKANSSHAAGPDGLHNASMWAIILNQIFQQILVNCAIPDSWRTSLIAPIFKKGDCFSLLNYGPIALLDAPGKIFAQLIMRDFNAWTLANQKRDLNQSGFVAGMGTVVNLFCLNALKAKCQMVKQPIYFAFIDLHSALDSVSRVLLMSKLQRDGCPHSLSDIIYALHSNTSI